MKQEFDRRSQKYGCSPSLKGTAFQPSEFLAQVGVHTVAHDDEMPDTGFEPRELDHVVTERCGKARAAPEARRQPGS